VAAGGGSEARAGGEVLLKKSEFRMAALRRREPCLECLGILNSGFSDVASEFLGEVSRVRYLFSNHLMLVGVWRSHCMVSVTPDTSSAQALDWALRSA
jgi:hypothetical protein